VGERQIPGGARPEGERSGRILDAEQRFDLDDADVP
jgi:hypothetical protein